MPYEIEQDIDIEGIKCSIFLICVEFPNTEVGIYLWDMNLREMFIKKLVQRIAKKCEVSFKKQRFGGNPPIYREVFTVKVGKKGICWREYLNPTKKEIKDELENVKKKLIKTVRKLNLAIDKIVFYPH